MCSFTSPGNHYVKTENDMHYIKYVFLLFALSSCLSQQKLSNSDPATAEISIASIKFLDQYIIPYNHHFQQTWVGGLSGIDYDRKNNKYFIISDERSATSAARFYSAEIDINHYKIDTVRFTAVASLRDARQDTFPALKTTPERAADPESIRYNPINQTLIWSSEGDKKIRNGHMVYQDPYVYEMDLKGRFKDSFLIPDNVKMYKDDRGARENGVFEGISFTPDYKNLWVSMEGPVYEDGPLATVTYKNAPVRFTLFDAKNKKPLAQYGYLLDAVARPPVPENAFSVNGVSEIFSIGQNQLLVLERSFSTGSTGCVISLYLADFSKATDVKGIKSLYQNNHYSPALKKLLYRLNDLDLMIDNVEGITVGPKLPNGHFSMILIADNNFSPLQQQQVFLFEIIP